ncbi:uncharacterized protein PSFLO_00985 [Pseudozyma flocculosa]|uniref:Uncharacterized protein n=1 Tax=Pseudozyma flocculosa TaxID=84751 RepID=A0A5C3ET43_9BASI|nr:uncharacterized protein PSFLO_00985 [Pseudozyma flocculosa]
MIHTTPAPPDIVLVSAKRSRSYLAEGKRCDVVATDRRPNCGTEPKRATGWRRASGGEARRGEAGPHAVSSAAPGHYRRRPSNSTTSDGGGVDRSPLATAQLACLPGCQHELATCQSRFPDGQRRLLIGRSARPDLGRSGFSYSLEHPASSCFMRPTGVQVVRNPNEADPIIWLLPMPQPEPRRRLVDWQPSALAGQDRPPWGIAATKMAGLDECARATAAMVGATVSCLTYRPSTSSAPLPGDQGQPRTSDAAAANERARSRNALRVSQAPAVPSPRLAGLSNASRMTGSRSPSRPSFACTSLESPPALDFDRVPPVSYRLCDAKKGDAGEAKTKDAAGDHQQNAAHAVQAERKAGWRGARAAHSGMRASTGQPAPCMPGACPSHATGIRGAAAAAGSTREPPIVVVVILIPGLASQPPWMSRHDPARSTEAGECRKAIYELVPASRAGS